MLNSNEFYTEVLQDIELYQFPQRKDYYRASELISTLIESGHIEIVIGFDRIDYRLTNACKKLLEQLNKKLQAMHIICVAFLVAKIHILSNN